MTEFSDTLDQGVRLLISLTKRSPENAEARATLAENLIAQGDGSNGLANDAFQWGAVLQRPGEWGDCSWP